MKKQIFNSIMEIRKTIPQVSRCRDLNQDVYLSNFVRRIINIISNKGIHYKTIKCNGCDSLRGEYISIKIFTNKQSPTNKVIYL